MFALQTLGFMAITIYLDKRRLNSAQKNDLNKVKIAQPKMEVKADVESHAEELANDKFPILASRIEKVYPNGLQAVQENSFGVKEGEVLGIVGPKASGKSSIIKMLSLETSMSQASEALILSQLSTKFPIKEYGIDLGLCPQNDLIIEKMTVQ
jgi:ABC-type protease/lipase transport system fused ATPase/permease subunit